LTPSPYIRADLAPMPLVRSILTRARGGGTAGHEEGWHADPFGRHEARWMSDGTPTALVRDGDVESCDAPPDEEPAPTS
jgi:hypothetical protein